MQAFVQELEAMAQAMGEGSALWICDAKGKVRQVTWGTAPPDLQNCYRRLSGDMLRMKIRRGGPPRRPEAKEKKRKA